MRYGQIDSAIARPRIHSFFCFSFTSCLFVDCLWSSLTTFQGETRLIGLSALVTHVIIHDIVSFSFSVVNRRIFCASHCLVGSRWFLASVLRYHNEILSFYTPICTICSIQHSIPGQFVRCHSVIRRRCVRWRRAHKVSFSTSIPLLKFFWLQWIRFKQR